MANEVLEFLQKFFSPEIGVMVAGTVPIIELRGAIPLAVSLGMSPLKAFFFSVVGNLIPIPLLLWLLPKVMKSFSGHTWVGRKLEWWVERTRRRSKNIDTYGALGLVLFTAIPLPTTGAWTASLAAVIFKISPWRAFAAIALGVAIAGVIITLLSLGLFQ